MDAYSFKSYWNAKWGSWDLRISHTGRYKWNSKTQGYKQEMFAQADIGRFRDHVNSGGKPSTFKCDIDGALYHSDHDVVCEDEDSDGESGSDSDDGDIASEVDDDSDDDYEIVNDVTIDEKRENIDMNEDTAADETMLLVYKKFGRGKKSISE